MRHQNEADPFRSNPSSHRLGWWIIFPITLLAIFTIVFIYGAFVYEKVIPPQSNDTQCLTLTEAERWEDGSWTAFSLPGYLEMDSEERLRIKLDYSFSENTTPSLILQANHTFMSFHLGNEILYEVKAQDRSLGNYFTHIPLPSQVQSEYLEIDITSADKASHRVLLPEVYISDEASFFKAQTVKDIPSLILSTWILWSGVLMLIMTCVCRTIKNAPMMVIQAFFSFNIGVYFLCETFSVVYLFPASQLLYYLDMLTVSMIAPPILLLLGWDMTAFCKRIYFGLAGIGLANTVCQMILALTGVAEFRSMLPATHILQIATAVLVFVSYFLYRRNGKRMTALYPFLPMIIGGIIDIALFTFELNPGHNVYFMKIGLLVYIVQQMIHFMQKIMKQNEKVIRETYYRYLAFQDSLTECYSRTAYELDKCSWNAQNPRTVFSLDLNNLKVVNDSEGHSAGDNVISTFGQTIKSILLGLGKCYRIGGDEFIIFCDDLSAEQRHSLINSLRKEIDKHNGTRTSTLQIQYAIGVADTSETNANLDAAVSLADQRMYEAKREMKNC